MQNDILASLTRLSDAELVGQLKSFIARERDATAQIVARLVELDTRDIHLREGYSSLYVYCRDALGLSEWEAYNRIEVARAALRFPVILDMLTEGSVNLTAVRLLAPHLTLSNHREVLESARGKRKPEIEEIVARLSPRPDVPPSVRKLPAPQLTIGGDTLEKPRLAKDMLGHAIPSGDDAAILDRALTTLLVDLAKRKFADTRRPRRSRGTKPGARDASAAVKRAVWVRDLGRCAFIGTNGHRCNERRFIDRGRDAGFPAPPARIRACAASALGSCLRS